MRTLDGRSERQSNSQNLKRAYKIDLMSNLPSRITSNPEIFNGRAIIRGMRVRVVDVLDLLSAGLTHEQVLEELPYLEPDDISAAVAYAAPRID